MGGLAAQRSIVPVSHHFPQPHVVQRRSLLHVHKRVLHVGNGDRRLSGGDPLSRGQERFHQNRFHGGQVVNILVRFFLSHELEETGNPLRGSRVLRRGGEGQVPFVLRFQEIFEGF